ncbi:MAG TPA: copper resistance protein NlpE N-terminal domain-containing protein [Fluviicola sp.]|nr:copper resistance protein NlpE N-terminal domain-containing protein [Fluviicola sp.]
MTKRVLIVFMGLFLLAAGCIEHRPTDTVYNAPDEEKKPEKKPKWKGLRVYEGVIPCADCSGIYQRLSLRGDSIGAFRLTEVYRDATEDGDETIVTTGSWKRYYSKKGPGQRMLFYLSEGSLQDSTRMQRYEVQDGRIIQVDLNGKPIADSNGRYVLKLIQKTTK